MIAFSNSKINLGLYVSGRRSDGYHDIETVMVPIGWGDILEVVDSPDGNTSLTSSGRPVDCPEEKNLTMRAYRALNHHLGESLPPLHMFLRKIVPDGAGLGGGSGDASAMLKLIDRHLQLGLTDTVLAEVASTLGADCPFFIYDQPMLATGIGTDLSPISIPQLDNIDILVVKPPVAVSTQQAYLGIDSAPTACHQHSIPEILAKPITQWRDQLVNDFEPGVFAKLPRLAAIKRQLYDLGAIYAAMSGSGSALFGLFAKGHHRCDISADWADCVLWSQIRNASK